MHHPYRISAVALAMLLAGCHAMPGMPDAPRATGELSLSVKIAAPKATPSYHVQAPPPRPEECVSPQDVSVPLGSQVVSYRAHLLVLEGGDWVSPTPAVADQTVFNTNVGALAPASSANTVTFSHLGPYHYKVQVVGLAADGTTARTDTVDLDYDLTTGNSIPAQTATLTLLNNTRTYSGASIVTIPVLPAWATKATLSFPRTDGESTATLTKNVTGGGSVEFDLSNLHARTDYQLTLKVEGANAGQISTDTLSLNTGATGATTISSCAVLGQSFTVHKHLALPASFAFYPDILTVNPTNGTVWVHNVYGGNDLFHVSKDGTQLLGTLSSVPGPRALDTDPVDGSLWVGTQSNGLKHISSTGEPIEVPANVLSGGLVWSVAVDQSDRSVWYTFGDSGNPYFGHVDKDGNNLLTLDDGEGGFLTNARAGATLTNVVVDSVTHTALFSGSGNANLHRVEANGDDASAPGLTGDHTVAFDPSDSSIWTAHYSTSGDENQSKIRHWVLDNGTYTEDTNDTYDLSNSQPSKIAVSGDHTVWLQFYDYTSGLAGIAHVAATDGQLLERTALDFASDRCTMTVDPGASGHLWFINGVRAHLNLLNP